MSTPQVILTRKTKFELQCEAAEDATNISVHFFRNEPGPLQVYEDDGAFFIRKRGVRACFDIGQDRPLREQNERIKTVAKAMGVEHLLTDKILSSDEDIKREENEDDDRCPCCGNLR